MIGPSIFNLSTFLLLLGFQLNSCIVVTSQTVDSTDWPGFRGPGGQGIATAVDPLVEWNGSENVLWKSPLPGAGASSPIVFGNHVYLTAYSGFFEPGKSNGSPADLNRHLLCFDRDSGRELWRNAIPAKLPEEEKIRDHGFAANTPAADADRVYCFFGKSGVVAISHAGKQIWQADVGSKTSGWGTAASPVLYRDLVIINASVESESLIALNRNTGELVWRADDIHESWNTPVLVSAGDGKTELVVATHGAVRAYNPDSGKLLWTCQTDIAWYMVPSVVSQDGIVFCLGGRSGVASLAVKTGGSGDVTKSHRLWTSVKGSNVTSPIIHEGHLYWINDQSGIAYCARADSGEIVYEERLRGVGQVYASAILIGERIYYLARDGKTFVLDAKPEFKLLAVNDLQDGSLFNGSPAVAGNRMYLRSDRFLYAIGK